MKLTVPAVSKLLPVDLPGRFARPPLDAHYGFNRGELVEWATAFYAILRPLCSRQSIQTITPYLVLQCPSADPELLSGCRAV